MAVVHAHLHMFLHPHLHGVFMQCMWHARSTITDNNSGINHHIMAHKVACTHKKIFYFVFVFLVWCMLHLYAMCHTRLCTQYFFVFLFLFFAPAHHVPCACACAVGTHNINWNLGCMHVAPTCHARAVCMAHMQFSSSGLNVCCTCMMCACSVHSAHAKKIPKNFPTAGQPQVLEV